MIIIAIVRLALSTLPNGVTDVSWLFFWQGIEAATAIIMVSLTAFPGLFGQEGSRVSNKPKKYVPTTKETGGTSTQRSKKSLLGVSASRPWKRFNLPSIPSATMTGMGTFAKYEGRGDRSAALREEDEMIDLESQRPLRRKQPKQGLSGGAGNSAENAEQRPNVVTAPTNEAGALTGARLLGPPIFTLHDHDFAYQEHGEDEDERQPSITSIPSPLSSESGSEETPGYETLLSKSTEETDPLAKRKLEIEAKKLKLADLKRQRLEREEVRRAEGKSDDDDRMLIVDLCSGERSEPDAGAPPPPPPKERAPQASPPMMAKSQPLVAKAQEIRRKQVPNQPDSQVSPTKGREKRSME